MLVQDLFENRMNDAYKVFQQLAAAVNQSKDIDLQIGREMMPIAYWQARHLLGKYKALAKHRGPDAGMAFLGDYNAISAALDDMDTKLASYKNIGSVPGQRGVTETGTAPTPGDVLDHARRAREYTGQKPIKEYRDQDQPTDGELLLLMRKYRLAKISGKPIASVMRQTDIYKLIDAEKSGRLEKLKYQTTIEASDPAHREFKRAELQHELGHERNNIQVSINGRPWKVFAGKGTAGSAEERRHLQFMKDWAARKSTGTGKTWTVSLTGAPVSESVFEGATNDYFKRRKDEEDRIAGTKPPAQRIPQQTDYQRRRNKEKQGVAEGEKDTSRMNKQSQEFYNKNPNFKRDDRETKSLGNNRLATRVAPTGGLPKVAKKAVTPFRSVAQEDARPGPLEQTATHTQKKTSDQIEYLQALNGLQETVDLMRAANRRISENLSLMSETSSPAQQAAIAIAMKKAGKKPKSVAEGWSQKYKNSINCSHPKGFSQKAHCAGKKKHNESVELEMTCPDCGMCETHGDHSRDTIDENCWKGYHKEGNKELFGKTVPNCVKNEDVAEKTCPHCAGPMFSEELMMEKKDACYYKVKSRYKVWPSAYASGALVKCRKRGAANWGSKTTESLVQELEENLHDWFHKEKWVRMDTKGNIKGDCAREPGEGKPKCLPQAKAHALGKKGRASAAQRKRRQDPNPERHGSAINVATKEDAGENSADWPFQEINELSNEKLTQYKHAAAADAGQADLAGNYKHADKRFSGIIKATKKQFANDVKKYQTPAPIQELSKDKLKRYAKANVDDQLDRGTSASFVSGTKGDKYNTADETHRDRMRQRGLDRALNKLSK